MASNKSHDNQNHPFVSFLQQDHHHRQNNQATSFGMIHRNQSNSSSSSAHPHTAGSSAFTLSKEGAAYDLGELDQALFLYLDSHDQSTQQDHHHRQNNPGMRPPTLNIFPSQPMHVEPSPPTSKASTDQLVSPGTSGSKKSSEPSMELSNPRNNNNVPEPAKAVKGNRRGPNAISEQEGPKTPDPKTLRRLAQNREAARKSRLRKKAYVQQLESSRMKLTQLEQEIQRAKSQGFYVGGNAISAGSSEGIATLMGNISSDGALFDLEYGRWLEQNHRLMVVLRNGVQDQLPENELQIFVDNVLAHYDQLINLKGMIVKSDVFHLISGIWKTPAERCFMWMGGFRPTDIIKIIANQIEPLSEQQLLGIYGMQQAMHESEAALTQGLDALNNSLTETITSDSLHIPPNVGSYMGQMSLAMNRLATLEGFVRQADNLRRQTLHRLHQMLTIRQAARCFLAIAEYFHRLRALSSLWMARSRQE